MQIEKFSTRPLVSKCVIPHTGPRTMVYQSCSGAKYPTDTAFSVNFSASRGALNTIVYAPSLPTVTVIFDSLWCMVMNLNSTISPFFFSRYPNSVSVMLNPFFERFWTTSSCLYVLTTNVSFSVAS